MSTSTTKLICPECRHENEPERVYCHSCGARLERSAVVRRKEEVVETRRRLRNLFDPQRVKLRLLFFKVSKLILGAFALAGVIQILLPPDVPVPVKSLELPSQIRFDLENMTTRQQPPEIQYSEDQVNAYLLYALKTKQSSLNKPLLIFKRALVGLRERACTVTAERSFFGFSLYTSQIHEAAITEGKIVASSKGGAFGRLPVHPQIAKFMDVLFWDVWSALDQERKLVAKLGTIEFHDKSVALTARPQ